MAAVIISGDVSGSVTLQAPSVAGSTVITLPSTSGTLASISSVTNNGVVYINSSGQPTSGSGFVFDGTNVGIGTSSPAAKLWITAAGDATFNSQVVIAPISGANPAKITFNPTVSSGIAGLSDGSVAFYGNGANTERMRIDSSGNVGIGTASPASKLHVAGSFRQTGATAPFEWTVNAGGLDYLKLNAVGYADNLIVANSGGNVGIGTSSPGARLHTQVSSGNTIAKFENTVSGAGLGEIILAAPNRPAVRFNFQTSSDSNGYFNYDTGVFKWFNNVGGVATQSLEVDTSANFKFNSGYGSVATAYGCRAWVNFNGTGTVAIRASGNVSSITDNGVGNYRVNFSTSMPDANYSVSGISKKSDSNTDGFISMGGTGITDPSTSSCPILTFGGSSSHDAAFVCVAIFR